ncbi:NPCBM/NEW2 domain-containing protein [Fischerella sp. PCC 9605]|uniref:NPCBM/NEW2 domain-containing protein n=1 Tax=Fischerella sp. PCC 9605 TaxID=1173024 RepID=UPI00047CEF6A|nr:NPCBM/NEW2 domain-containing protein [Fischerella sp. PCC 9605]
MLFIYLITGMLTATALGSSVITAVILKQGIPVTGNNSTASPTPSVAETPTVTPIPSIAETPTASPTPSVTETPTASLTPSVAQTATTEPVENGVSLLDLECLSSTPGVEKPLVKQREPQKIAMGGEVLSEIAYLRTEGSYPNSYISSFKPAAVSCALDSKFRQLNLVVGINGQNRYAPQGEQIVFEISLDNKVVATNNLKVTTKQAIGIDVQNAKSIGIKATCLEGYYCPYVGFVEASLR